MCMYLATGHRIYFIILFKGNVVSLIPETNTISNGTAKEKIRNDKKYKSRHRSIVNSVAIVDKNSYWYIIVSIGLRAPSVPLFSVVAHCGLLAVLSRIFLFYRPRSHLFSLHKKTMTSLPVRQKFSRKSLWQNFIPTREIWLAILLWIHLSSRSIIAIRFILLCT